MWGWTRHNPTARSSAAKLVGALLAVELVVFGISTIPGVRSHPGFDPLLDGWLQGAAYVTAAVLCALRPIMSPVARRMWALVAIALALRALGFVVYLSYIRTLRPLPYPSFSDFCWLALPVLLLAAGVLFIRRRYAGVATSLILDGIVGAMAATALGIALLSETLDDLTRPGLSRAELMTNLAYPIGDLLLLFVILGMLVVFSWRPPRIVWLFALGVSGFAVVDTVFLYQSTAGTYRPGTYLAELSLLATSIIAVCPLLSDEERAPGRLSALPGIVLPGVFAATCLGVLVAAAVTPVALGAVIAAALGLVVALARTALTFRDISSLTFRLRAQTARVQQSEAAARGEAERLGAVLGGVQDYAIIGGGPSGCTFFSPGAERMLGWRAEEVVGRHITELLHLHSELDARAHELGVPVGAEVIVSAARSAGRDVRRWTYVRRDGSRLPVEITITALGEIQDDGTEFIAVARDVTHEQRIERYRATREALIAQLAPTHRVDGPLLNGAAQTICQGMGWDVGEVWLPEGERLRCAGFWMSPAVPGGADLQARIMEVRMDRGRGLAGRVWDDGSTVWIDDFQDYEGLPPGLQELRSDLGRHLRASVSVPLRAADDEAPIGVLQVFSTQPRAFDAELQTLTEVVATTLGHHVERVRTAQELRFARDEAEAANRAKTELVSRISHELRTPLNAILGFAQLLGRDGLEDRQRGQVDQITTGGRHLSALIDDLLDLGRIERSDLHVSIESVSATDVLRSVLDLARPLIDERGLVLEVDAHAGLYQHVLADFQRLRQVLLNLLSNAVKYNRPGGHIKVSFEESGSERLCFLVCDTGPGLERADLARLFQPFERLGAEDGPEEGTGLGLAVSKALVEAMGGRITVTSAVGEGTTFAVELERTDAPAHLPAEAPERAHDWWPADPSLTATILYIEDNPANLRLVEEIIGSRPGLSLLTAMQGLLGIELALRHQPDLVLLDVNLPDVSGEAVLERLRSEPAGRALRVLAISADATAERRRRLLDLGADGYITKPLDIPEFVAAVSGLLWAPTR